MTRLIVACCLMLLPLSAPGCTAASPVGAPAAAADAPLVLAVRPPAGDGIVGITVTVRVSGAKQFRFFLRAADRDDEIKVEPRGDVEFAWDAKGLAAGVHTLWASAYTDGGRFLGSSPLTSLVLTPANVATLPPLRGAVRDVP